MVPVYTRIKEGLITTYSLSTSGDIGIKLPLLKVVTVDVAAIVLPGSKSIGLNVKLCWVGGQTIYK